MRFFVVCMFIAACDNGTGGVANGDIGESCQEASDCEAPLDCLFYATDERMCLIQCDTSECPDGYVCERLGSGLHGCFPSCAMNADCPDTLPICKAEVGNVCGG